ncbi:NADH dehydrogenase (ubiquinone) complex I, assembly factor 6 [Hypsibius exemplaris]|uniref:NADH dehydrogenase (Ubiquinone) complex I, assembly factor 6 n=1 Tax=Hypsibius exemplaris TaxID=2072580 RepID=A0A9X6N9E7_HYPEX|nr:NADH dehydrogenase (ubiquinone) complex I, assembly factor 6 [Hypsibius exemplaris]
MRPFINGSPVFWHVGKYLCRVEHKLWRRSVRSISIFSWATAANLGAAGKATSGGAAITQPSQMGLTDFQYCMSVVKKADYENYLCCLLLPKELQQTAFAIRAFNVELAQIKDITRDKLIAQMRFQFWKDTLERIYSTAAPPASPVAKELFRAVRRGNLSKLWLRRLIDSRLDNLPGKPFPSVDAIDSYSENSVAPVLYLLLEAQAVKDVQADHAASHVGKAMGLTTVIRSIPFLASRGQVILPMDLLMKNDLSAEVVSRIGRGVEKNAGIPVTERDVAALTEVVFELAGKANLHIEKARSIYSAFPAEVLSVYLPIVPCRAFLDRLREEDFDIFKPRLRRRDGLIGWKLWWNLNRRTI